MTKRKAGIAAIPLAAICTAALGLGTALAAPSHLIHPGDQLAIAVLGEQSLTQTVTVAPDGTIAYPLVGGVHVVGETVDQVTQQLKTGLRKYLKDPQVSIAVTAEGNDNVLVLGNVKTPGKYSLPGSSKLTDAIAAAGGLGATNGDYPVARVAIGNDPVRNVSLQKLLREGDLSVNAPLGTNTVVYIPGPTPIQVQVLGAVDRPGDLEVSQGDRLAIAIAKAGNSSNAHADLSRIHVTHVAADGSTKTATYDLYRELNNGDLSADPVLQKGDIVYVPQSKSTDRTNILGSILSTVGRIVWPF
ncbi:MAG: polysaccharide export protein [bacterium]|nr:polysaccharide export protein [bacterium]